MRADIDPTAYDLGGGPDLTDPRPCRLNTWANFGRHHLQMPFMTQVAENLWQGGVERGLILPDFVDYKLSYYRWEDYYIRHTLKESVTGEMRDSHDQSFEQITDLTAWVNRRRADVNSFRYEPILDLADEHLSRLLGEVRALS